MKQIYKLSFALGFISTYYVLWLVSLPYFAFRDFMRVISIAGDGDDAE